MPVFRMHGRDGDEERPGAAPWSPMMEMTDLKALPDMMHQAARNTFKDESILANALAISNTPALAVSMQGLICALLFVRQRADADASVADISVLTRRGTGGGTEFCGVEVNIAVPAADISPEAIHRMALVYEHAALSMADDIADRLVFGRVVKGGYTHACASSRLTADCDGFTATLELMHKDGARRAQLPTGGDMERRLLTALSDHQCASDTSYELKNTIELALHTNMSIKEAQKTTESRSGRVTRAAPSAGDGRTYVGPFARLGAVTAEVLHLYAAEANFTAKVYRGTQRDALALYATFAPRRLPRPTPVDEDQHAEARSWSAHVSPHNGRFPPRGTRQARAAPY